MRIAEGNFYLKGKPFSLNQHPPFRAIYQIQAPKLVICSGRQVGKTGVGSALVGSWNGLPKRLDQMQIGDRVIAMSPRHALVEGVVTGTVASGDKLCVRITTRMGHVLDVALTHPIRRLRDYLPAGKISVGDRIAAVRKGGSFTGSSEFTDADVKLLGYGLGDGHFTRNTISFVNTKPSVLADFESAAEALGGSCKRYPKKGTPATDIRVRVTPAITRLIADCGLAETRSATKFVPDAVFDLSREKTALFINRLWSCDGTVKQNRPGQYDISYCSISERLVRGLQALLWKFGVPTSCRTKIPPTYEGTDKKAYILRVETQEGVRRFLTEIGALGKSENVPLPAVNSNNNRDTVPQEVQLLLDNIFTRTDAKRLTANRGHHTTKGVRPTDQGLRRKLKYPPTPDKLLAYVAFFTELGLTDDPDVELLRDIATGDVVWDEVVSVKPIGSHPCFDIEVAEYHNYVLNGVVTHNSTLASTFTVADAVGNPFWESLTVHPSLAQSRRFSNMRIAPIIDQSPAIKKYFFDTTCRHNTSERSLKNNAVMYFGAMSQMENLRGLSANSVNEDEVQDMVGEELAIVEEVMSGQHSSKRFVVRTGTAKTVGNILESTFRESTMNEWIVPCPSGHWNIPSVENIGPHGFICKKCKSLCDVRQGKWRAMRKAEDVAWVGFRIPQIILPTHTEDPGAWKEINHKLHHTDPVQFSNEVMGHAAGSGISILTEDHLKACCQPEYDMIEDYIPTNDRYYAVFATIDWGLTARKSFTVVGVWGIAEDHRIRLIYAKRYQETDVLKQVEDIGHICLRFAVDMVCADWGAGITQSRLLEQQLNRSVNRMMYVSEQHELIRWDPRGEVYKVNRTQAMTETFVKMRMGNFHFPRWPEFQKFAKDILVVYEEPLDDRNSNDKIKYDHPEDKPDDFTHVCVGAVLAVHLLTGQVRSR
jgi:intein/homing endonuclease